MMNISNEQLGCDMTTFSIKAEDRVIVSGSVKTTGGGHAG